MERWILYLHLLSVLLFMLAHGVQVHVMWRLRTVDDPERSLGVFESLPNLLAMRLLLAAVIVTGFASAILVPAWLSRGWLWGSLMILLGITWAMRRWGGGYFDIVETAAKEALAARGEAADNKAEISTRFGAARRTWHLAGVTVIGLGGLAVILWLMIFKPF